MVFTLSYLALFSLSAYYYKNDPFFYAADKEKKSEVSIRHYSFVNIWLRVSTLIVALAAVYSSSKYLLLVHQNMLVSYTGLGLAWVGMYFFVRAKLDLGDNYSPCYDAYLPHSITQKGMYRLIRHPIYTTNIFTLIALFIATGSLWILFNVLLLVYFYNKSASFEEAELADKYPDYADYMRKTNRYFPSPGKIFAGPR